MKLGQLSQNQKLIKIQGESNSYNNDFECMDTVNQKDKLSNSCFNDFIKKLRSPKYKTFTKEEEYFYISEYKNGRYDYKQKILEKNLPLVVKIAMRAKGRGVPVEDLINEGCIGLNIALEKFDLSKGFRFSTYAVSWIYKYVNMCVMNGRNSLKIPMTTQGNITKVLNIFNNDEDITSTNYTTKDLAKRAGMSERVIDTILASLNLYSVENLEDLLTKDYSEGLNIFTLNYAEPSISTKQYEVNGVDRKLYVTNYQLKNLPEEDLSIIQDYYGLNNIDNLSVREIAYKYKLSYVKTKNRINSIIEGLQASVADMMDLQDHNARITVKFYLKKNNLPLRLVDYYIEKFWEPCGCALLPANLASVHFFVSIKYGVNTAIKLLQKATKSPQEMFLSEEAISKANDIREDIVLQSYKKLVEKHMRDLTK